MSFSVVYTKLAQEHLDYWERQQASIYDKIVALEESCMINPFRGIGKPEALKHNLAGKWSRRIDPEHRFVYEVKGDVVIVLAARFHY